MSAFWANVSCHWYCGQIEKKDASRWLSQMQLEVAEKQKLKTARLQRQLMLKFDCCWSVPSYFEI